MNDPTQHTPPSRSDGAIDEFESMFKRAERTPFRHVEVPLRSVAVVTDGAPAVGDGLVADLKRFLPQFGGDVDWQVVSGDRFDDVNGLLEVVGSLGPDLIVTSRCLDESALVPQHTLGVYVDVLTQTLPTPVLLLPGTAPQPHPLGEGACRKVMVVTDHLAGDDRLVNHAVRFVAADGTLWLCHVEDDVTFERYMEAIGRIPQINTLQARELIAEQLLAVPTQYVESCTAALGRTAAGTSVERVVEFGHRITRYRELVEGNGVDLLVTNTKDEDQLAMHGMAYALSVEITDVAQLLL